jgi:Ser/Thr protein kinase RdoA (MazF antagonist)
LSRPPHRPPAWSGLQAGTPLYAPAEPALATQALAVLGSDGRLSRLADAGGADADLLRFDPADVGPPRFLKLLAPHRADSTAQAEAIAGWLESQGAAAVPGQRLGALADGRVLWSYPFVEGQPPRAEPAQLAAIGSALGRVHCALAEHPERDAWLLRTDQRIASLRQVRQALARRELLAGPDSDRLAALAADATASFAPDDHPGRRTPLHGDLNLFNMLMAGPQCVFLDWEDVVHSVLPPAFDLATVFERVVLVDPAAAGMAPQLLQALLGAYHESSGTLVPPQAIQPALRGLALRALCTLAASDPEGADDREWRKFFHLLDLSASVLP